MKKKIRNIILVLFLCIIVGNIKNTTHAVFEMTGSTAFESVGKYSIAIAGNNNADLGTGVNVGVSLISSYPSNWDTIKSNIPSDILNRVNNMSGSFLEFNGTVVKSFLTTDDIRMINGQLTGNPNGDVLLIQPDGTYQVIEGCTGSTVEINITQTGWYYVSILDAQVWPQDSWAISTIYTNDSLSLKYIKILNLSTGGNSNLNGTSTTQNIAEIYFRTQLKLKSETELFGIVIGGGQFGWQVAGVTEDKMEAILSDNTYKQLYEDTYNGTTIFEGRSTTDFFNGTFNTIRSHNIKGGELDIFHETLGRDYFNDKDIIGYRISKIGTDGFSVQFMGIAQEIYYPEISITTELTPENDDFFLQGNNVHTTVTATNVVKEGENNIAYNSTITSDVDEALSNISNIVVKVDGVVSSMQATYDETKKQVILENMDQITPGQVITIDYDATINSNINDKVDDDNNAKISTTADIKSYIVDTTSLTYDQYKELYITSTNDDNLVRNYKVVSSGVKINHIDKYTNSILLSETKTGYVGDSYTASSSNFTGYSFEKDTAETISGTMTEDLITINFYYLKQSNVVTKYIDEDTGKEISGIDTVTITYNQGDTYTTEEKTISGYTPTSNSGNTSGTIARDNIEVIYYYKQIKGSITVTKVDKNDSTKKIEGATFKLEKLDDTNNVDTTFTTIEKTTDTTGKITYDNLSIGKYRLTETKAPTGYELSKNTIEVEIDSTNTQINVTAEDTLKLVLPQTGKINYTVLIIALGSSIMIIAYVVIKKQKKLN